jgi:hypothetical protein
MDNRVCCVSNACPLRPAVCLAVKLIGEPDALIGYVRFDEEGLGNGALPNGPTTHKYDKPCRFLRI